MTIYCYVTDQCRKDAHSRHSSDILEKICDDIQERQSLSGFRRFSWPYLVLKKHFSYQSRIVAEYRTYEDNGIIILHRFLLRSDNEYLDISQGRIPEYLKNNSEKLSDKLLIYYIQEQVKTIHNHPLFVPSQAEADFLYPLSAQQEQSTWILESIHWVETFKSTNFLKQALQEILSQADYFFKKIQRKITLEFMVGGNNFHLEIIIFPENRLVFILGCQEEEWPIELKNFHEQQYFNFEQAERLAGRQYPDWLLSAEIEWLDIQSNNKVNLVLSPEETRLLQASRSEENRFPLFINGRAGSGKSTIIYYLFSQYLAKYLEATENVEPEFRPPIFFTYSKELAEEALGKAKALLINDLTYLCDLGQGTQRQARIEQFFDKHRSTICLDYKSYLWQSLSVLERNDFLLENFIDFSEFEKKWENKFSYESEKFRKKYSPHLCWQVIRTYIKGIHSDFCFDPEDYENFEARQKTVSDKVFNNIYEKIWQEWYRPLRQQGYWDVQDLVAFLLNKKKSSAQFPAIFCDEAQDFTRLELELILRSSLFSERKLRPDQIRQIPIVFAADPLQTIQPSGFRWTSFRAAFFERFIQLLDHGQQLKNLSPQPYQLHHNYRAKSGIVRFTNMVLALRKMLFGDDSDDLPMQTTWKISAGGAETPENTDAFLFDEKNEDFWQHFQQSQDTILVVPCEPNQEADYIRKRSWLLPYIQFQDINTPVNILSVVRAKGLEFSKVAVFGFGDQRDSTMPANFLAPLNTKEIHKNQDELPALEIFANRLYVAVSRAKNQLFIVDSDQSPLWQFSQQTDIYQRIISQLSPEMAQRCLALTRGTAEYFIQGKKTDIENNAKTFFDNGQRNNDIYLIKQALGLYIHLKNVDKVTECKAILACLEQQWVLAGKLYLSLQKQERALYCFWQAVQLQVPEGLAAIKALSRSHPELLVRPEVIFSIYDEAILEHARKIADFLLENTVEELGNWHQRWLQKLQKVVEQNVQESSPLLWQQLLSQSEKLSVESLSPTPPLVLGWLYWHAQQPGLAVQHWQKVIEKSQRPSYFWEWTNKHWTYPDNIETLQYLNKDTTIIDEYLKLNTSQRLQISLPKLNIIKNILLENKNWPVLAENWQQLELYEWARACEATADAMDKQWLNYFLQGWLQERLLHVLESDEPEQVVRLLTQVVDQDIYREIFKNSDRSRQKDYSRFCSEFIEIYIWVVKIYAILHPDVFGKRLSDSSFNKLLEYFEKLGVRSEKKKNRDGRESIVYRWEDFFKKSHDGSDIWKIMGAFIEIWGKELQAIDFYRDGLKNKIIKEKYEQFIQTSLVMSLDKSFQMINVNLYK